MNATKRIAAALVRAVELYIHHSKIMRPPARLRVARQSCYEKPKASIDMPFRFGCSLHEAIKPWRRIMRRNGRNLAPIAYSEVAGRGIAV